MSSGNSLDDIWILMYKLLLYMEHLKFATSGYLRVTTLSQVYMIYIL